MFFDIIVPDLYFELTTQNQSNSILRWIIIPPIGRRGGSTVLSLSVLPSASNNFRRTDLSNHASQPLHTWYSASAMGLTRCLPNSSPPVISSSEHEVLSELL